MGDAERGGRICGWWMALLLVACGGLVAFFGFRAVSFDVDPLDLLPDGLHPVEGLRQLRQHFAGEDEIIIGLCGAGEAELALAAESLALRLSEEAGLARAVRRPGLGGAAWEDLEAGAELVAYALLCADGDEVDQLVARMGEGRSAVHLEGVLEELESTLDGALLERRGADPFGLTDPAWLAGEQLTALGGGGGGVEILWVAAAAGSWDDYVGAEVWLGEVRGVLEEWRAGWPGIDVLVTGEVAFQVEISRRMEGDLSGPVGLTAAVVSGLFLLLFRRVMPLLAALGLLAMAAGFGFWVGDLMYGGLTIMGAGFAAVLLGLVIDYAAIIYRECQVTGAGVVELRRRLAGPVLWASATTAAVFGVLGLSGLPGVAQLGVLVAAGVLAGAALMLLIYLPLVPRMVGVGRGAGAAPEEAGAGRVGGRWVAWSRWLGLGLAAGGMGVLWIGGVPGFRAGLEQFRPDGLEAGAAWEQLAQALGEPGEGLTSWQLVRVGGADRQGRESARELGDELVERVGVGGLTGVSWPWRLWPDAAGQRANALRLAALEGEQGRLRAELEEVGFADGPGDFLEAVLVAAGRLGEAAGQGGGAAAAMGEAAAAVLATAVRVGEGGEVAMMGRVEGLPGQAGKVRGLAEGRGGWVASWDLVGEEVLALLARDLRVVFLPTVGVMVLMLGLALRRWRDLFAGLGAMVLAGVCLLAGMRLMGGTWTAGNLAAIPLLAGTGLDYTIHIVHAARRHAGDLRAVWNGTGRALVFCGLSTAVAFGSLALADNSGLSALGATCACGVLLVMVICVGLLPGWLKRRR